MKKEKQTFIAEARRNQIMEAAIQTLDEIGFVKASLTQIAKRAGISTALISYHFKDKFDLMNHLLVKLMEDSISFILKKTRQENTIEKQLSAFIMASLEYQYTHSERNTALIEIVFNSRTAENVPYYKINEEDDVNPLLEELKRILREGQDNGVFGDFQVEIMATIIQGSIGEYMFNPQLTKNVNWKTYGHELVNMFERIVKKS